MDKVSSKDEKRKTKVLFYQYKRINGKRRADCLAWGTAREGEGPCLKKS